MLNVNSNNTFFTNTLNTDNSTLLVKLMVVTFYLLETIVCIG